MKIVIDYYFNKILKLCQFLPFVRTEKVAQRVAALPMLLSRFEQLTI